MKNHPALLGLLGSLCLSGLASATDPSIAITVVPPDGSAEDLEGTTTNVDPATHRVVVYVSSSGSGGWFIEPTTAAPLTTINSDGSWAVDITVGVGVPDNDQIVAYVIPLSYSPPLVAGDSFLPDELEENAVARTEVFPGSIQFAGYDWIVKKANSFQVGPGPNFFSDDPENVWVDDQGRLHLKITNRDNQWQCAEVQMGTPLGPGRYTFEIDSPVDDLNENIVLGLFSWTFGPSHPTNREIDIEFSRWGNASDPTNAQFVVQPFSTPGNLRRLTVPATASPTTHSFTWAEERAAFVSRNGAYDEASPAEEIDSWVREGAVVPDPGNARIFINFWLFQGNAPSDNQEAEIIISKFDFSLPEPKIDSLSLLSEDTVGIQSSDLLPNVSYRLDRSMNLTDWLPLETHLATEAQHLFTDTFVSGPDKNFYRIETTQP